MSDRIDVAASCPHDWKTETYQCADGTWEPSGDVTCTRCGAEGYVCQECDGCGFVTCTSSDMDYREEEVKCDRCDDGISIVGVYDEQEEDELMSTAIDDALPPAPDPAAPLERYIASVEHFISFECDDDDIVAARSGLARLTLGDMKRAAAAIRILTLQFDLLRGLAFREPPRDGDGDIVTWKEEAERLRAAVQRHHDQRADDRCHLDDDKLYYDALGLGPDPYATALPPKADMLASCERYIDQRQHPEVAGSVRLPGCMTIAQLTEEVERLRAELAAERARFDWVESNLVSIYEWDGDDGPPSDPHWCVDDPDWQGGWMNPTLRGLADRAREGTS